MNIVCKNCETHFKGKFCPQCAQKASAGRLQVGNVLNEFWHNLTHTDHSVLSFIKGMFVKPGLVIREFIEGKRKKYFNPYTFFILVTGILIFVTGKLFEYEDKLYDYRNEFGQYIGQHYNIIIFACFPFLALLLKGIFFKQKYNYAEWVTFLVFTFGIINFIQIIFQLIYFPLIKYHYDINDYATYFIYFVFGYVLLSFLKPLSYFKCSLVILATVITYFFIKKIGSGIALLQWGVSFKKVLKGI
jgi:Protein of unknown function (DUF3667)